MHQLLLGRAQRAIRPFAGCRVVQRVFIAIGADVPQPRFGGFVGHSLHRPAARRASLPDGIERCHFCPCHRQFSSEEIADSSLAVNSLAVNSVAVNSVAVKSRAFRFLTPRPQAPQLGAVMLWGVSWSRSSTEDSRSGRAIWRRKRTRSPGDACWIWPSGTMLKANLDRATDVCQRHARPLRTRSSHDRAKLDRGSGGRDQVRRLRRHRIAVGTPARTGPQNLSGQVLQVRWQGACPQSRMIIGADSTFTFGFIVAMTPCVSTGVPTSIPGG